MRRFAVVLFALVLVCLTAAPVLAAKPNLNFTTHMTLDGEKLGRNSTSGFVVDLNGLAGLHELGVVGTKTNPGLAPDFYPFYLDADAAQQAALTDYFDKWGCTTPPRFVPQSYCDQIEDQITGGEPFFYLTYDPDGNDQFLPDGYFLADGFTDAVTPGGDFFAPLQIDGDYPLGTYAYAGTLVGTNSPAATLELTIALTVK